MPQWMQLSLFKRLQSDALQAIPDLIEMVLASLVRGCGDQKQRKTWQDRVFVSRRILIGLYDRR